MARKTYQHNTSTLLSQDTTVLTTHLGHVLEKDYESLALARSRPTSINILTVEFDNLLKGGS
jgi:hypothetical protein